MSFVRRGRKRPAKKPSEVNCGKIKHTKVTIDGFTFDSKLEGDYYKHLCILKFKNKIKDFELQPEFLLQDKFIVVDGVTINGSDPDFEKIKKKNKAKTFKAIKYIADFKIIHLDGSIEIVDTKGIETADFKIKKKMFAYRYPQYKFSIIAKNIAGQWKDIDQIKKEARARAKLKAVKEAEADK